MITRPMDERLARDGHVVEISRGVELVARRAFVDRHDALAFACWRCVSAPDLVAEMTTRRDGVVVDSETIQF